MFLRKFSTLLKLYLFHFLAPSEEYPTWKRKEKILKSVSDWLHYIGLGNYESNFVSNGFDHLDFVGCDILTRQDLKTIGIVNDKDTSHLIDALQKKGISKGKFQLKTFKYSRGILMWLLWGNAINWRQNLSN